MFKVWYLDSNKWVIGGKFNKMVEAMNYIWHIRENNPGIRIKVKS